MVKYQFICLTLLNLAICLAPKYTIAQADKWVGTWEVHYKPWPHIPAIDMEIQIAKPVKNMLYPTKLKLSHQDFEAAYEVLLVKKNDAELGVGRNKYPLKEEPYSLGPWLMYLNGVLHYQEKGKADSLTLKRLWIDNFGVFMKGIYDNELYTNQKSFIRNFLYQEAITFSKKNNIPWNDPHLSRIVDTDSIYYGVYDPIKVDDPHLELALQDEERYDRDTVTVVHNGHMLANGVALEQAMELNKVVLDTGENYIAFFAENYGDIPPNTANFLLTTKSNGGALYGFNFADRSNVFSTVMVGRFQYKPKEVAHSNEFPQVNDATETRTAGRRDVSIGALEVKEGRVQIEVWDEQVEDGDVISLYHNGVKVISNVAVRKRAKRFTIALRPGRNSILFFAENLGLIAPNTAALRIKSGEIEKELYLYTDLEQNNLIEIVWKK